MANNLSKDAKIQVISALCEDCSIRGIERMTGIHRDTIMRLGVRMGEGCAEIHDAKMQNLPCADLQVDEIWGFIGKKNKHATPDERNTGLGDAWTFVALDRGTKLVPSFVAGKREAYYANMFLEDLAGRSSLRPQLSSDALSAYDEAVEREFGAEVDCGQVVKTFTVVNLNQDAASRYSPAECCAATRTAKVGNPVQCRICTSHVEKQNHTMRTHIRRLTRLTNAFSKQLENFKAAIALHFARYNVCKIHLAIRTTPAQAAGVEQSIWTVGNLIEACGE
jgi:IS1 family transposase